MDVVREEDKGGVGANPSFWSELLMHWELGGKLIFLWNIRSLFAPGQSQSSLRKVSGGSRGQLDIEVWKSGERSRMETCQQVVPACTGVQP